MFHSQNNIKQHIVIQHLIVTTDSLLSLVLTVIGCFNVRDLYWLFIQSLCYSESSESVKLSIIRTPNQPTKHDRWRSRKVSICIIIKCWKQKICWEETEKECVILLLVPQSKKCIQRQFQTIIKLQSMSFYARTLCFMNCKTWWCSFLRMLLFFWLNGVFFLL